MLPIPTKLFFSLISEPVINNADLQEELTICKNNSVALPELIEVFKKTCHLRILLFGKGPKDIAKYITTYPALSKPDGHYLVSLVKDSPHCRVFFLLFYLSLVRKVDTRERMWKRVFRSALYL